MMLTQDTVIKKYRYRAKPLVMILCAVFFTACGYAVLNDAQTNDRGLIIDHLIELDMHQATIFYWALFACCVGFVGIALVALISALTQETYVEVTDKGILVPAIFRNNTTYVQFADVTQVRLQKVQRQAFLILTHPGGKASISRANMPSKTDFEELVAMVDAKLGLTANLGHNA